MNYVVQDFQKEKQRVRKLAFVNLCIVLISITITLICYFADKISLTILFGVISGLTAFFLLIVLAERLELNNLKNTEA